MTPRPLTPVLACVAVLVGLLAGCSPPNPADPATPTANPTSPSGNDAETHPSPSPTDPDATSGTREPSPQESGTTSSGADPTETPSGTPGETDDGATTGPSADDPTTTEAPGELITDPPVPPAGADVTPTVVFAGVGTDSRVRVNSFVPGVLEEGGTCSAVLTGAGTSSSSTAPAFPDASATWCDELVLEPVDGDPADWTVVVTYSSPAHQGSSTPTTVSPS